MYILPLSTPVSLLNYPGRFWIDFLQMDEFSFRFCVALEPPGNINAGLSEACLIVSNCALSHFEFGRQLRLAHAVA